MKNNTSIWALDLILCLQIKTVIAQVIARKKSFSLS